MHSQRASFNIFFGTFYHFFFPPSHSLSQIAETKSDQFGNYTCEARNRNGFANATVVLYKSKIAICPPVCGDIDLTSGQQQQLSSDKSVFCVIVAFIFHLFYFKG